MSSIDQRVLDLLEKQATKIAALEEQIEALRPKEPAPVAVPDKPYSDMTMEEKKVYLEQKYGG